MVPRGLCETCGGSGSPICGLSPEAFVKHAVAVGHPFAFFLGLPEEVKAACQPVAKYDRHDIVNDSCSKWLSGSSYPDLCRQTKGP